MAYMELTQETATLTKQAVARLVLELIEDAMGLAQESCPPELLLRRLGGAHDAVLVLIDIDRSTLEADDVEVLERLEKSRPPRRRAHAERKPKAA